VSSAGRLASTCPMLMTSQSGIRLGGITGSRSSDVAVCGDGWFDVTTCIIVSDMSVLVSV